MPTAGEYNNIGIVNYSGAKVIINGNLTVESGTFLSTRGGATTEINKDGKGTVKINGDINFNYDQPTSGTSVDAIVDLNLTTQDSVFNGNIFVNGNPYPPDGKKEVGGMTLGLANGAQWNTDENSFVNKLNFNDGIINVNGGEGQEVKLGDINGSGGTVNMLTSSDLKTAKLSIGTIESDAVNKIDLKAKAAAGPKLTINYTGITADDLNNVADDLGGLAKNISVAEGTNTGLTATANVAEGLLKGSVSADLDTAASGSTVKVDSVKQNKESSTMTSMRNIASVAIVSWRQEDSTLSQRLGELRNSKGDQGIWARMSRGEFEYSGAYKNQYNFFQLGYDKAFGSWHYGAAISHNDGKTTYDSGKGENKSTSLSLYGTWLGDRGHYTDIVLKQGRLSNEYDNYAAAGHTHGDYDAWETSLSGEYGMKVGLDNGWYVTPQAQLTLMRIGGEDYTTNNGIKVNQDTLESCVGRVGFEMGKTISDKGSIYAKASLLHEFAGNADTYLNLNSISNSYSQDIGGTWYEAGLGFNFKTTDNSYVYADVVKTFGDDIKKIYPVINEDGSDSAMLDNYLNMLTLSGIPMAQAVMMAIPEPWENNEDMDPAMKAFYEYHSCITEPWDGPAAVAFTDGRYIGATLDRNGLRPARYYLTSDDMIILSSEVGVTDVDESTIIKKERLHPGKMLLIDTEKGKIISDEEIKKEEALHKPYAEWVKKTLVEIDNLPLNTDKKGDTWHDLVHKLKDNAKGNVNEHLLLKNFIVLENMFVNRENSEDKLSLLTRQKAFGYTWEDVNTTIKSIVEKADDPIGAMGADIPLAVLSEKPQLLYNYFKQLFAQVTNPPIDAIREQIVTSTYTLFGCEQNLLTSSELNCRKVRALSPILTNEELEKLRNIDLEGFKSITIPSLFNVKQENDMETAMDTIFEAADIAIENGYNIIILSDKGVDKDKAPIPALLVASGLHHHLIRKGTRMKVSIVLESGEPREVHHFACLVGYGVNGINPYMAYEAIKELSDENFLNIHMRTA